MNRDVVRKASLRSHVLKTRSLDAYWIEIIIQVYHCIFQELFLVLSLFSIIFMQSSLVSFSASVPFGSL